jgi:uncharacterized protein (DUF488 family)
MTEAIFTIGHSTQPIPEFTGKLKMHGVQTLVDIRTIPRSRYNPQYEQPALKAELERQGIGYRYMQALGGLRRPQKDSPNGGWRNLSFRGYADYMQTEQFQKALESLIGMGKKEQIAVMCAEAVPWRCHRSLVADALTVHHIPVFHIMPDGKLSQHKLTLFAQVNGTSILYPSENLELPGLQTGSFSA